MNIEVANQFDFFADPAVPLQSATKEAVMDFDPSVFGLAFHRFVELEYEIFGKAGAPLLHICTLLVLLLVLWRGNRARMLFSVFYTFNWLFLLGFWGVFAVLYWMKIGAAYLLSYLAAPILLAWITVTWIRELFQKKIDLDLSQVPKKRWIVLPVLLWGFWYPTYLYGQGFVFKGSDLLSSYYGLMPCPTTMLVLALFTLNYPRGNRTLFHLMTIYALLIGTATVLTGWLPDIPFILIGLYSLGLIWIHRTKRSRNTPRNQAI